MPAAQVAIVRLARRRSMRTTDGNWRNCTVKGTREQTDGEIAGTKFHQKAGQKHARSERAHGFAGKRIVEDQPECPVGVSRFHVASAVAPNQVCAGCRDLRLSLAAYTPNWNDAGAPYRLAGCLMCGSTF